MRRRFIVKRGQKSFVLYAGLLDEAHRQGLRSIATSLLQVPAPDNGEVAICAATVETERGTFGGIGDASPENVTEAMRSCLVRMAETRAKARALRDAVNLGVIAFEEVEGAEETSSPAQLRRGASAAAGGSFGPPEPLTAAQLRALQSLTRAESGANEGRLLARSQALFGRRPEELSKQQASELITLLRAAPRLVPRPSGKS